MASHILHIKDSYYFEFLGGCGERTIRARPIFIRRMARGLFAMIQTIKPGKRTTRRGDASFAPSEQRTGRSGGSVEAVATPETYATYRPLDQYLVDGYQAWPSRKMGREKSR